MRDSLDKSALPNEQEVEEWAQTMGAAFTDSDHSMKIEFEDETIKLGVDPHSGPWIKVIDSNGKELGDYETGPTYGDQVILLHEDETITVDVNGSGRLGKRVKLR